MSLCFLGMLLCCGFCDLFGGFLKVVWVSLFTLWLYVVVYFVGRLFVVLSFSLVVIVVCA